MIADSNACERDHWLAKLAFDVKPEDYQFFMQPGAVIKSGNKWVINELAENIHNLPDRYYDRLMQARRESWIRQNLANEFIFHSDGRAVHPDFNEVLHVKEMEAAPSMPLTAGLEAVPAPTNDWEQRTTALDVLLTKLMGGEPALVVHPRCWTLVRGLVGEYQFRRLQVAVDERYHDKPLKNAVSHVCEALHYGLLGAGEGVLRSPAKRKQFLEQLEVRKRHSGARAQFFE